jgi:hypothetical protein
MKQITVLVPNKPGQVAAIAEALAMRNVNVESFSVEGHGEDGFVMLVVDKYDEALRALRDAGYKAVTQDALLIRLEDRPGGLATIAVRLKDAGLDVRSMHIVRRTGDFSVVSMVTSDNGRAAAILRDVLIGEPPE